MGHSVVENVRTALASDPRVRALAPRLSVSAQGHVVTVAGEVLDIAQKKLALHDASSVTGVFWVEDRVRVTPASPMADSELREHVSTALAGDLSLADLRIRTLSKGVWTLLRDPPRAHGEIRVLTDGGIVTLDGEVPSLAHKRLAVVLAWWVPGTRDVVDDLDAIPFEQDSDEEISESVRVALEKDPFVDALQLRVRTELGKVILSGLVTSDREREIAEHDAWYVPGVEDVVNVVEVRAADSITPGPRVASKRPNP